MTYAAQQDLIDRFGETEVLQLSDHENTGDIDADVVARALGDADALIDSYLATKYTVPLSPVPDLVKQMACDIARYLLYRDSSPDLVTARYNAAVTSLKALAAGTATLGGDAGAAAAVEAGGVQFKTSTRVFNQKALGDYGFGS